MMTLPGEDGGHELVLSEEADISNGRAVCLTPSSRVVVCLGGEDDVGL